MTTKETHGKKPGTIVRKQFLKGNATDENTMKNSLIFFGSLLIVFFMAFVVSATTSGNNIIRLIVSIAIIALTMVVFFNKGSVHGHELKFCFNTLHHAANELPQPTEADLRLADTMSSVWAQFAHNGNPNIPGLPAWQPYTAQNGELMVFNHDCFIRNNPDRDLEQIIDRHCFRQLDEFRKNQQHQ